MNRLVVLDRDGVINQDSDSFIRTADEWLPIDGSLEAIGRLTAGGYTVAVASNQSGIGRGLLSEASLSAIHDKMREQVVAAGGLIDKIVYCPHLPDAGCACRKPRPGLLILLRDYYNAELGGVPVIGDSGRDLAAARAVGARPMLVMTGNGKTTKAALAASGDAVEVFDDLASAANALLMEIDEERQS